MVRVMGMATLELTIYQELSIIDQEPLLLMFLDLIKAYDTLDQGRLFTTLKGYGDGTHMCGILEEFCERQEVIIRKNRHHGPHFKAKMGTTQRGLIFPNLLNLVV